MQVRNDVPYVCGKRYNFAAGRNQRIGKMDTSSKQQRTYEESKRERESGKRNGKSKEVETEIGNWKSLNWESLKLETGK